MKSIRSAIIIIALPVLACSCSSGLLPVGHYQEAAVVADGNTDDWELPLRFSNPQYTLQYNVTNDKENVYICIITKDDVMQKRILKGGMTVYFDPKGETSKKINIAFPVKKTDPDNQNAGSAVSSETSLILHSDYYNATGFANMENGLYSLSNTKNGIKIALKQGSDSSLVYEASIPIKNIPGEDLTAKKGHKNLSIGIGINQLPNNGRLGQPRNNTGNAYSFSPRMSGGGGGMRGGGMRGGGMGGRQQGQDAQNQGYREDVSWYQFSLATK